MSFKLIFCLFFLSFILSGCFELVEEVNIRKDGSGTFRFEANLSQSKTRLDAILGIDSLHGFKIPDKQGIIREFEKTHQLLSHSTGISQVTEKKDFDNYIFSIGFDFKTLGDLNRALAALRKVYEGPKAAPAENPFRLEGLTFERFPDFDAKKERARYPNQDLSALGDASLTCIYRFDQHIQHYSNSDARLSQNGKALMLKLPVSAVLSGEKTISDIVSLQD